MPVYSYVAINKQGKEKKGSFEADSIEDVRKMLRLEGSIPLQVYEQSAINKDLSFSLGKPVKIRELSVFCRQIGSLLSAGVVIIQALGMLSKNTENKRFAKVIKKVQQSVEKGETLADSMMEHKNIFTSFMIHMIKAGEASGNLDSAFVRLADHFDNEAATKSKVKKAMIYPIAILVVMVGVIFVMMLFVVPNFSEMFAGMGTDLPKITQMIINMSNYFTKRWYLIIGVLILVIVALQMFSKSETGKMIFGRLALTMPLFGKLTVKSSTARFARTISTLISTGVPMMEALDITSRTIDNTIIKKAILSVKDDVSKGSSLSAPIASVKVFPDLVSDMIAIGEETGDLDGMLVNLANYYDEEVKVATDSLLEIMQPLIIVVMAAIVGVFVAAMMSPIMKMYKMLDTI
jgi:type IV pilus assembly protein PilC